MAEVASHANADMLNELLIAKLLEEDMLALENARAAEELQLHEALSTSALAAGRFPKKAKSSGAGAVGTIDDDFVLTVLAAEINANKDALMAQSLQHAQDSNMVASRQYAQKLAAAEKKSLLDAEFARRLQLQLDEGDDDDDEMNDLDAESVLGQDAIENIMAADMNEKGKGRVAQLKPKEKGSIPDSYGRGLVFRKEEGSTKLNPVCGICMEPFQATYSPSAAARSANSSDRIQFGTHLTCPQSHGYCISCLNNYINSKLDPDGSGLGNTNSIVFPIRCPECPINDWPDGLTDEVAQRVLTEEGMTLWHRQKLLDSIPKYYCPNPKCSELVQTDEDSEDPQAMCPSCDSVICVPCRVIWHDGLTCDEYQDLPLDERSPDDQKALQLMKAQNWRRCPNCAIIVELTLGCNHITCRCKTEFCFRCGAIWDVRKGSCSRRPSCDLWDEDMLLEERERQREREQGRRNRGRAPVVVVAPPAPPPLYEHHIGYAVAEHNDDYVQNLDWMDNPDILCTRHWFTANMINSLTCQYCDAKLNSIADLRYHLSHVRWHSVYACCGRFFKRDVDFERHLDSPHTRLGLHAYTFRRN
ncbi:hypothetical protein DICSQDRAFT_160351 [Dichomitus squalens LYAD-421 SS1]|uniref:RBR-type E3 ubiquitin transferase n=1 Tax=Dichomitus squalens TaxID=114155 RepID=A0A4V2K148_9APHY|nr:uncharacterized protein DICSQDRAFT_160351 [Dichomitus squalens LYAD-421 SS1]EJF63850.1 hypothetical protein DICSQDRAFT_160351 [Dichomitus squalens LYAD-421 SS1]TBU31383.1 hypothetical protein BD311DRAFT_752495 [Dichomitus squalens]